MTQRPDLVAITRQFVLLTTASYVKNYYYYYYYYYRISIKIFLV